MTARVDLHLAIAALLAAAALAPPLVRLLPRGAAWLLAAVPAALTLLLAGELPAVAGGAVAVQSLTWVPALGLELSLRLDGLGLLMALLITGLGAMVLLYAGSYLAGHAHLGRFYAVMQLFIASMLGVVLADDLMLLFVAWELTSFCSFLLIGFEHQQAKARQAALQALLVTGLGGLALLAGLLLLGAAGGSHSLSSLADAGEAIRAHGSYPALLLLILLGALTKSAQFPFHFWLPNAMAAPTPVSAYLHSATMVKAGVFLLARLDPLLGGTALWVWILCVTGGVTMLLGAVLAIRERDLKRVLAYSTLTALGTLTVLLGLSFEASIKAAMVFLVVHSLYKGALFLAAGIVDHETGTRRIDRLGGLWRAMPITAVATGLAALSMAGLPPLFGFVGKELTYKAKLGFEGAALLLPALALVANALTMVAALLLLRPFFGRRPAGAGPPPRAPHEAPPAMWLGPAALAATTLLFGLLPGSVAEPLIGPAVTAVAGHPVPVELALWYGPTGALALSVLTVLLGLGATLALPVLSRRFRWLSAADDAGPGLASRAYQGAIDGLLGLAGAVSAALQHGDRRRYLLTVLAAAAGLTLALVAVAATSDRGPGAAPVELLRAGRLEWLLGGLLALAALATLTLRRRVAAAVALSVVGLLLSLAFLRFAAPDLAPTQLLVETMLVALLLATLRYLPARHASGRGRRLAATPVPAAAGRMRLLRAAVALTLGGLLAAALLLVVGLPLDTTLAEYYAEHSVPGGRGRNIVNVILVDFRALDTLGEIAVVAAAALGAGAMLERRRAAEPPVSAAPADANPILAAVTRLVGPLLWLVSLAMLLRGHNAPGGGFIAGLLGGCALALGWLARDGRPPTRPARLAPATLLAAGLVTAIASGLVAALAGAPAMTGQWIAVGPLSLGTPLLFDLGVYLVVLGFAATLITALSPGRPVALEER